MVFHGISIIVRTANDCDFQRQKRYVSVEEEAQQLDRSNVSDALFPHRRRCAKTFLPTYGRKYAVIYRDIAARFATADTEPKRRSGSGSGSVSCGGGSLAALSKNHSRILPLTFLHFAQPPRAVRVCARARACTNHQESEPRLLPAAAADGIPPTDSVCRHVRVRRALKDRFFGVTGSRSIPLWPGREDPTSAGCASRCCTCHDEISRQKYINLPLTYSLRE